MFAAIFMACFVLAFCATLGEFPGMMMHLQFGPALLRTLASFSSGALATITVLLLLTLFFGRFYCAAFCPFGIIQDFFGWISRRRCGVLKNFRKTRYVVAGISFGMLLCGWSLPFLLLDPYSNSGRILRGFNLGGLTALVVIAGLAVWKKRLYCTTLCPVGTMLGLVSGQSLFRLTISDKCVKCNRCVDVCPAGCIDLKDGIIDSERCVRCLNCLSACRVGAVSFARRKQGNAAIDHSRRAFMMNGGALIAGIAAGAILGKTGMMKLAEFCRRPKILPPGAEDMTRMTAKCTACQLCTANCPEKIIIPAESGYGPVSLDLSRGSCLYDCNLCSQLCPTGALRKLTLQDKQRTKIAEASFNPATCLVFQYGETCDKCAKACPTGAITLRKTGAPRLNTQLCIGCGACQYVCPAEGKAMTVHEIERQLKLEI